MGYCKLPQNFVSRQPEVHFFTWIVTVIHTQKKEHKIVFLFVSRVGLVVSLRLTIPMPDDCDRICRVPRGCGLPPASMLIRNMFRARTRRQKRCGSSKTETDVIRGPQSSLWTRFIASMNSLVFRDNQIISNELTYFKIVLKKLIIYLKGSAKSIGISSLSSSGIVASYCTISNWGCCCLGFCSPKSEGSIEDELTPEIIEIKAGSLLSR